MNKKIVSVFVAAVAALGLASRPAHAEDIVGIAMSDPKFSTLVAAVKAAGLVETLKGKGPFTVFAPTNAAFAKLPKGTVESLLKPANKAKLVSLLTYHVVPGKVMAATVVGMTKAANVKTVQGTTVRVNPKPPMVNNAKIIKTDIEADNGVIHVIDTVIMPRPAGKMHHASKMKKKM